MTDPEFHDFCMEISALKFESFSEKDIDKQVLEMVATGNLHNKNTVSSLKADGIKPSMASDIWSDSDVSLMGTMLYYIDANWTGLHAMLIGATGFSGEGHTGDNIPRQGELDLESVGRTFEKILARVSDQGSYMKKAWGGLPHGYCTAHTLDLAVKEYLEADGDVNGMKNTKGMTTYLHRSGNCPRRLSDLQKELQGAVNQPPQMSNAVCCHYTHDSMNCSMSRSALFKRTILTMEQRPDTKMVLTRTVIWTTATGR